MAKNDNLSNLPLCLLNTLFIVSFPVVPHPSHDLESAHTNIENMLINADIGEMTGKDPDIMPHIDIGNIACGYHASTPEHMDHTVQLALSHQVRISAHPGYADPENFGRVSHSLNHDEALQLIETQVHELHRICEKHHTKIFAIKAHGALYHNMLTQEHIRKALITTAIKYNIPLIVPAQSNALPTLQWPIPTLVEVFADRAYTSDGELLPRSQEGALHLDPDTIIEQAKKLTANNQTTADTLCFHGDNPASVTALKSLYAGH